MCLVLYIGVNKMYTHISVRTCDTPMDLFPLEMFAWRTKKFPHSWFKSTTIRWSALWKFFHTLWHYSLEVRCSLTFISLSLFSRYFFFHFHQFILWEWSVLTLVTICIFGLQGRLTQTPSVCGLLSLWMAELTSSLGQASAATSDCHLYNVACCHVQLSSFEVLVSIS